MTVADLMAELAKLPGGLRLRSVVPGFVTDLEILQFYGEDVVYFVTDDDAEQT